ncbi:hypothetical protein [Streptomyces sp. F001]|uniref:hypothetical protein n=1 Tax=Streptomyces sp. F001 TaxID=1510026 RepID=UPI0013EEBF67|nr:hypothetical protein [Streptomyces sp. F001]
MSRVSFCARPVSSTARGSINAPPVMARPPTQADQPRCVARIARRRSASSAVTAASSV